MTEEQIQYYMDSLGWDRTTLLAVYHFWQHGGYAS